MTTTIIQEFIQALDEEVGALKKGKGGKSVYLFNGKFLREFAGKFVYLFHLENLLSLLEDSPATIRIEDKTYIASVMMTKGLEIEVGVEGINAKTIPNAWLTTNQWDLLEKLKGKYVDHQRDPKQQSFQLSDSLFTQTHTAAVISSNDKAKYSCSKAPLPNDAQAKAIGASFNTSLCVIWGPPGTGKTKTIAQAVETHLNAGRRVLLVSHANNAVDEALEDIAYHLRETPFYKEGKLVRLGKPQEEHYAKQEKDFEMVLPDKIIAKFKASLINKRQSLQQELDEVEKKTSLCSAILNATTAIKTFSAHIYGINSSIAASNVRLSVVLDELGGLQFTSTRLQLQFAEAESAGKIKRFLKRMHPEKIQEEINKNNVSIDFKKIAESEIRGRLVNLLDLRNAKEREVGLLQNKIATCLFSLNMSRDILEAETAALDKRQNELNKSISEISREIKELEKKIYADAKLLATTLTKTFTSKLFPEKTFDVLILDEASMAPMPLIYWAASKCHKFITIVGDFLQLPPICISREAFAQKWLSRSIFSLLKIDSVQNALHDARVNLLDTQYRMNPIIADIPNHFFYQNLIKNDPGTMNNKVDNDISESPLVLIDSQDMKPWCSRLKGGGRFNLYNALLCATLAKRIIDKGANVGRIGIITPYRAQARLINKIATDWKMLENVKVSTVHLFQGGEEQVIIFDTVEGTGTSIAPMLDGSKDDSDPGLLLNVAISRAKSQMYFIGDSTYLRSHLSKHSILYGIVDYLVKNAEIISSAKIVDTYITSDFDKWSGSLSAKVVIPQKTVLGDPHIACNFLPLFSRDLNTAKSKVSIHSPWLAVPRVSKFMECFKGLIEKGIAVYVHTWDSSRHQGHMAEQSRLVMQMLREIGVSVIEEAVGPKKHFKTAIIDNRILWDGSLNILSHRDTEEHMWRYEGTQAVEQIIRDLNLNECSATGHSTENKVGKLFPDHKQMATSDADSLDLEKTIVEIKNLLASVSSESRLNFELNSYLTTLRKSYQQNHNKFSDDHIAFLQSVRDSQETVEEFITVLNNELSDVCDSNTANELFSRLMKIEKNMDGMLVQKRVKKEIRELRECLPDLEKRDIQIKQSNLHSKMLELEKNEKPCGCGGRMVIRENRDGFFWGCESFPQCFKRKRIGEDELGFLVE